MTTLTENGSYVKLTDLDAAENVAKDAHLYQLYLAGEAELSRSLVPGISTAATVVSAFCGVAGLIGHKSDSGEMEINIMNNTPYPLVPSSVYSQDFGFQEAARLMPSGESTSLKGCTADGFTANKSYIKINFLIGNKSSRSIGLSIKIAYRGDRWQITDYTIDNKSGPFSDQENVNMQYLGFYGQDIEWPSFSVHLLPNRSTNEAKTNLIFYPTTK